ncbi:Acetolactate synthase [Lentibacillus sp. JNUCC-1]|nr:Acetolactate synthase [Lentibacillus sp. JNUCC-1]
MKTVTAAQAVVSCIEKESIEHVFCVPGESYLPVLDALYDTPSINVIAGRHEGGASFMAEAYAKASGKPGVVMATRGVGAANLSIGVHTAYQDSTPMVVFLGQVHRKFRGREGFQEVDLDQLFQPISKWAVEVNDPERMPELVQRAFRIAQTGRPGPVVVSLPEDVLPVEVASVDLTPIVKPAPAPGKKEVEQVSQLLSKSKRPVMIAGGGVKSAGAEEALQIFAEKYTLPVVSAFRRHDVFPNNHPLYTGHLGLGTHADILDTVRQADTVLAIGTRLSEVTTQDYQLLHPDQTLIHIDIAESVLGKSFPPSLGIVASADEALEALKEMHVQCAWGKWTESRRLAYEQVSLLGDAVRESDMMRGMIASMQEQLPANTVITNDAGNFASWLHTFYQFKEKQTYVGPTSGAMGYGMPAAVGVKLARPHKTVVSLSGTEVL